MMKKEVKLISLNKPSPRYNWEQAYPLEQKPSAETHLREIEEIAKDFARLEMRLKKMPRSPNWMISNPKKTLLFSAVATIIAAGVEQLVDTGFVQSALIKGFSHSTWLSLTAFGSGMLTLGVYLEAHRSSKIQPRQIEILADKIITQYTIDEKIKSLAKQGHHLHSLNEEQAEQLKVVLGGEKRSRNPFIITYRYLTRHKRQGHLFSPGIFNSALNIDFSASEFYLSLGKTETERLTGQMNIDIPLKARLRDKTYYGSLNELIVAEKVTSIPSHKKEKYENEDNPKRAKQIARESMKPASEQVPFSNTFYTIWPDQFEADTASEENTNGSKLSIINGKNRQLIAEVEQRLTARIDGAVAMMEGSQDAEVKPRDETDPTIIAQRKRRMIERQDDNKRSNYSAGSVVESMIENLLPQLPSQTDSPDTSTLIARGSSVHERGEKGD
jgi:hypothetical protein